MYIRRHAGFTLIEILVVVTIIAIVSAMMMLRIQPTGSRSTIKTEINRFDTLLELATEQAIIQGQSLGVYISERGYSFYLYDPLQQRWVSMGGGKVFRARQLADGIRLELEMEAQEIKLPLSEDDEEDDGDLPQPQILLLSSGDITPCDVYFENDAGDTAFQITIDPNGEREIVEHEFGI